MSTEKRHLEVLQRRKVWLDARIKEADDQGRDLCFDKAERSALRWAIERLGHPDEETQREEIRSMLQK